MDGWVLVGGFSGWGLEFPEGWVKSKYPSIDFFNFSIEINCLVGVGIKLFIGWVVEVLHKYIIIMMLT